MKTPQMIVEKGYLQRIREDFDNATTKTPIAIDNVNMRWTLPVEGTLATYDDIGALTINALTV